MGAIPGHADLVRAEGFRAVNGQKYSDVARTTLESGASMVAVWDDLEPICKQLVTRVRTHVDSDEGQQLSPTATTKLLMACASVVAKVGTASQGMLRASEGLQKLALLMDLGTVKRKHPSELTQKQLAGLLVETLKKLGEDGPCPVCKAEKALEVTDERA